MPATSVLSDGTIRRLVAEGRVRIEPWDEAMVQPASVDLRLGSSFRVFHNHRIAAIDLADPPQNLTELVEIGDEESFVIHPGEFVLGRTLEYVELPDDVVARIEGKSSLGRLGLIVHATAGFVDPGFKGTLTLEITNLTRVPDRPVAGQADRAALVHDARPARRAPVRPPRSRLALPEPGRRHREPLRGRPRPPGEVGSRPMVHALLVLAAEEAEPSKTGFYVVGGALAAWAVVLGVIGLRSPEFPGSERGARGVMAISAVLVVAAMAAAVLTS